MLLSVHVTHVWIRVRCRRVAVFRTVMSQRRMTLASIDTNKGAVAHVEGIYAATACWECSWQPAVSGAAPLERGAGWG